MNWPPPYPSPYYNLSKKEQAEYEAVVERDGDRCIETGGAWHEFHHVLFGAHKRKPERGNMVLLSLDSHREAHGPRKREKQQEYLRYLEEYYGPSG